MRAAKYAIVASLWVVLVFAAQARAADENAVEMRLSVTGGQVAMADALVSVEVELPEALRDVAAKDIRVSVAPEADQGRSAPGQILRDEAGKASLWWVLPEAKAGEARIYVVRLTDGPGEPAMMAHLVDTPGSHLDLLAGSRKVLRYMYANDTSTEERALDTYKAYHHVYDLTRGAIITKGPGGEYTHHRGIFIGWTRLACAGKQYDFWSMANGERQVHRKFLSMEAGPVLARYSMLIDWIDAEGKTIVTEEREVTAFRQPVGTLLMLDFVSRLRAVAGDVDLGGDPEHGGFQYRAHNQAAERAGDKENPADATQCVRYRFPRPNVDAHKDTDQPWAAMSYVLDGKRYSVQHMDHPSNPRPTFYSAYRNYGRFGAFFQEEVKQGEALTVRYRIWAGEGDLPTVESLDARQAAFVEPPSIRVID